MSKVLEFRPRPPVPNSPLVRLAPTPSEAVSQLLAEEQVTLPRSVVEELVGLAYDRGDDCLVAAIDGWSKGERESIALWLLPPDTIDLDDAGDAAPSA